MDPAGKPDTRRHWRVRPERWRRERRALRLGGRAAGNAARPLSVRRGVFQITAMPHAYLTRRVAFAAAHRYRIPDWTDEQNEKAFGPCARTSFHGHSYTCDVTIRGSMHPVTGFVIDLTELDRILEMEVTARFDHRNINTDVAEFADGLLIPSGENLAKFIFERVSERMPDVDVIDVTVAEDQTLSSSYRGNE